MSQPHRSAIAKIVGASLIGTTIEWYDFFLYTSAAALVFNKLFFPTANPLTGTLLAFLTYAVGFLARPIGGLVFGHYGDRLGPQEAADRQPGADGRLDLPDGRAADVRECGRRGSDPADAASARPGLRARRGMGWRGPDRLRTR